MSTREIDERIAAALEQVAGRAYVVRIEVALQNTAKNLREEAAAAEPASEPCEKHTYKWNGPNEPQSCRVCGHVLLIAAAEPTPPPSLVERARKAAEKTDVPSALLRELADALDAAQAAPTSTDPLVKQLRAEAHGSTLMLSAANTIEWYQRRYREMQAQIAATMERKP